MLTTVIVTTITGYLINRRINEWGREVKKDYKFEDISLLYRCMGSKDKTQPTICIIDEIFRGTNSEERISAAERLLEYLIKQNAAVIVATHDLELTQTANSFYKLYHFSEKVGQVGLEFDYKLKDGVSTTRNALKILGHLGYPSEIVGEEEDGIRF